MSEKDNKQETIYLSGKDGRPVRLTYDAETDGKVIKIEVYVTKDQKKEIFRHFPNKTLNWKETAPHFSLLRSIAAYRKGEITQPSNPVKDKALTPEELAKYLEEICQATAPLYAFINNPYLENPSHPLHKTWRDFFTINPQSNKIDFLKKQLKVYQDTVEKNFKPFENTEGIKDFFYYQQKETKEFIEQLERFSAHDLTQKQLKKLCGYEDLPDSLNIISLGAFLRSQATAMTSNALTALDEIVDKRFNQLFEISTHPLRKELVNAKTDLEKQKSSHAARFLNTYSPIPTGQLAVIQGVDPDADSGEKRWLDVTSCVNCKTFLGKGIDGWEGLDDIDQLLWFYVEGPVALEKPAFLPYRWLMGEEGALGILAIVLFGLPAALLAAAGIVSLLCVAMTFDLLAFLLQAAVLALYSPLITFAIGVDFILQIPSFFTEKWEHQFSLLEEIAKLDAPLAELSQFLRRISLVRWFKQFFLDHHPNYTIKGDKNTSENINRIKLAEELKKNQAEGFFNLVGSQFFNLPMITGFLREKLKQLFYAMREIGKVLTRTIEVILAENREDIRRAHREKIIENLKAEVKKQVLEQLQGLEKALAEQRALTEQKAPPKPASPLSSLQWAAPTPLIAQEYQVPLLDVISGIGGGVNDLVDGALQKNSAIATLTFALSMLSLGTLTFPGMITGIPAQVLHWFQVVPQYIAKLCMGKELGTGIGNFIPNELSVFLQWQLSYFAAAATTALSHGDIEIIKKILENPEEITLIVSICVGMGYCAGFIPELPTHIDILGTSYPNPFTSILNLVTEESREVVANGVFGPNTAELFVIGIKSLLLVHSLLSGKHHAEIAELKLDVAQLVKDVQAAQANLDNNKISEQEIICLLLRQHGIPAESDIAASLIETLLNRKEQNLDISLHEKNLNIKSDEIAFIRAREELHELFKLAHNMEILGLHIDGDLNQTEKNSGYPSTEDAGLAYDEFVYAIKRYNTCAKKLGLFHAKINADDFLHAFYNKHCYSGSSGWHKLLFGVFLFPLTWVWRGFKYAIGTPSMREQVKKSFSKDFAMLTQIIPDVIAPTLRTFLKAFLYTVRMFLGSLLLPCLVLAIAAVSLVYIFGAMGTLFVAPYAVIKGIQGNGAKTFVDEMQGYFSSIKGWADNSWNVLLCNPFANTYIKFVSHVGRPQHAGGTGSLHRLDPLKESGFTAWYRSLARRADTCSEHLHFNTEQLLLQVDPKETDELLKRRNEKPSLFEALAKYYKEAKEGWKPTNSARRGQLERFAQVFAKPEKPQEDIRPNVDKARTILEELDPKSRLRGALTGYTKLFPDSPSDQLTEQPSINTAYNLKNAVMPALAGIQLKVS